MIHASGLARRFRARRGTVEAVRGVDIDVEPGELVGFLGPNGAGKTTTLRMLTTLLTPTAGTATVAGCDLLTDPVGFVAGSVTSGRLVALGRIARCWMSWCCRGGSTACRRGRPTPGPASCSTDSTWPAPGAA